MEKRCENCEFWFEYYPKDAAISSADNGECRKNPPPFGRTKRDKWCGDFKEK